MNAVLATGFSDGADGVLTPGEVDNPIMLFDENRRQYRLISGDCLFEDDGSAAKTETIDLISGEHVEGIQSTDGIVVPSHPAALFLRISDA